MTRTIPCTMVASNGNMAICERVTIAMKPKNGAPKIANTKTTPKATSTKTRTDTKRKNTKAIAGNEICCKQETSA